MYGTSEIHDKMHIDCTRGWMKFTAMNIALLPLINVKVV